MTACPHRPDKDHPFFPCLICGEDKTVPEITDQQALSMARFAAAFNIDLATVRAAFHTARDTVSQYGLFDQKTSNQLAEVAALIGSPYDHED